MNMTNQPLNEEELFQLEHFMLYRSFTESDDMDDRPYVEGFDEGILCLNELDGFLTAIVSGPIMVPPSVWMQFLWGDDEPVFDSDDDFNMFFSLLSKHMNTITVTLMEQPERFYPLFECREVDGKDIFIVDEWCEGYMRAVSINEPLWLGQSIQHDQHLEAIRGFTQATDWRGCDETPLDKGNERAEVVWHAAFLIHQFWLNVRSSDLPEVKQSKVGRNDPCPCGSGKKYKKCCLH